MWKRKVVPGIFVCKSIKSLIRIPWNWSVGQWKGLVLTPICWLRGFMISPFRYPGKSNDLSEWARWEYRWSWMNASLVLFPANLPSCRDSGHRALYLFGLRPPLRINFAFASNHYYFVRQECFFRGLKILVGWFQVGIKDSYREQKSTLIFFVLPHHTIWYNLGALSFAFVDDHHKWFTKNLSNDSIFN